MITQSSEKDVRAPGAAKRPLFNRPTWAQNVGGGDGDIFRRSNRIYADVGAEKMHKKQENTGKRALESTELSASDQSSRKSILPDYEKIQRREGYSRAENGMSDLAEQEAAPVAQPPPEKTSSRRTSPQHGGSSLLQQYEARLVEAETAAKRKLNVGVASVIDLEDDSDIEIFNPTKMAEEPTVRIPKPLATTGSVRIQDEEFPELARKAREKARRKRLEQDMFPSGEDSTAGNEKELSPFEAHGQLSTGPALKSDPTLQILVTSSIKDTRPLIVTRKLSQRLKDVRSAWVEYQEPHQDILNHIFLTWRGNRIFDVTSCNSLGITVDDKGSVFTKGDALGDEEGRLHMVAMTAGIFEAYKKAKESTQMLHEQSDEENEAPPELQLKAEPQIKIILKARTFSDFKLIVKPTTLISKIVNAFRNSNQIEGEKDIFLSFDGERLNADCKIGDTEISDMDYIDVYVK